MPDTQSVERTLGELVADVRTLREAQSRHEDKTNDIHADVVAMRERLAELKSESAHGVGVLRHIVTAVVAAIAGMFGGHVPLPGAH